MSYVMAGKVVNVKLCGSHQHHLGLIARNSEIRHYAYTQRYVNIIVLTSCFHKKCDDAFEIFSKQRIQYQKQTRWFW